jgi:formylglycine-generating enzyme required for sulfatase activity
MVLVRIEPGEFDMGSGDDDEPLDMKPSHHVQITKYFYIGKYEVTRGQFRRFVEQTGHEAGNSWRDPALKQTDAHPVVGVSWDDAVAFCKWLSEKEGVTYRLLTEAEWEYACRAGSTTRYCFGDQPDRLGDFAWFADNSGGTTHPVGSVKHANNFGLYDMHGNAWEWCSDIYAGDYYRHAPAVSIDPQGPSDEKAWLRALRGGGLNGGPRVCRSASRRGIVPAVRDKGVGFRVARVQAK